MDAGSRDSRDKESLVITGSFEKLSPIQNPDEGQVEPIGRSGHCCAADDNNLYVFGGYNPREGPLLTGHGAATFFTPHRQVMSELWVFNFCRKIWKKIESPETPQAAASSCMILVDKKLFIYGGTVFPFGHLMSNTLHVCDIANNYKWYAVEALTSGNMDQLPPRAYGQSIFFYNGRLYSFAGAMSFYMEPVSDLHCLHISSQIDGRHEWERLQPTGDIPKGRYKQEVVVDGDKFYVFGGGHLSGVEALDKLHTYNFTSNHWTLTTTKPDQQHGFPKHRSCFGCVRDGRTVLVCGGRHYDVITINHEGMKDMWTLSLDSLQWTCLPLCLPNATYFHGVSLNSLRTLHIYGGIINEDVRSSDLYKLQLSLKKLCELSWDVVLKNLQNIHSIPEETLHELGIPHTFVSRLKS